MSNHTPEPWRFEEPEIVGADGYRIAEMIAWKHGPSQCSEGQDNWRRILACVNACAGMEDPSVDISTLKAQHDELLIAIKALRGDKPCGHNYTCCCPDDLATAAIANAEKGKP